MRSRVAAALVAAIAIAGCGDDESPRPAAERPSATASVAPVGEPNQGSVVQFADCDDWRKGSEAAKQATIVELRDQLTLQSDPDAESPLSDERAFEIFESSCAPSYAGSLRLYKLYARAQGFAPLADDGG